MGGNDPGAGGGARGAGHYEVMVGNDKERGPLRSNGAGQWITK